MKTFLTLCALFLLLNSTGKAQEPREVPQAAVPGAGAPAQGADPRAGADPRGWWNDLPAEKRERLRQRWGAFRDLPPERQEELRKRLETVRQERSFAWRWLDESERRDLAGRGEEEQRRWIDERVRERIQQRVQSFERQDPEFCRRWRDLPHDERMKRGAHLFREQHLERARAELERGVSEGWIGPAAAEWLRQAGEEELLSAVGQVQRWRFFQRAEAEGLWQRHPLSAEERTRLLEMPIPLFFEEMHRLRGEGGRDGPPRRPDGMRHGGPGERRPPPPHDPR